MMTLGIPAYRLPRAVINRDISVIQKMGVEIKTNVAFGKDMTLESLKKSGFKAVFLATGLHQNRNLNVKNEEVKGVLKGVDFLRDVALGQAVSIGKKVIVVGGGNVAVDVALTAIRSGAKDVSLVCLEDRDEMPAWEHEISEAIEDGVKIVNCFGPNKFLEQNGRITGVEFKRCTCVFDECGTFDPQYDQKDLQTLGADTVIIAIGQTADLAFIENENIFINPGARIAADPVTLQTSRQGVFAGGDVFYGPKSIVAAIGSGREAALSIDRYLKGLSLTPDRNKPLTAIKKPYLEKYDSAQRAAMPCLASEVRTKDFAEVRLGFTAEMVARESKRCISCGSSCIQACPYDAIAFNVYTAKTEKCNLCYNRVINGLYPACADNICLAHCIHFGDPAEIEQKITEKRKLRGGWGEIIPQAIAYAKTARP
jgi:NADPH-dependent glutamate synthase beta subunit-like oxidoreductase